MSMRDEIKKQNAEKSISDFEKYSSDNTEYSKKENKFWSKVKDAIELVFKFWLEIFSGGNGTRAGSGYYGRSPRHSGSDFRDNYRVPTPSQRISHEDLQRRLIEYYDVVKATDGKGDPPAPCDCDHEK